MKKHFYCVILLLLCFVLNATNNRLSKTVSVSPSLPVMLLPQSPWVDTVFRMNFCPGTSQAQIIAPVGYIIYQWYEAGPANASVAVSPANGGNTPTLTIANPVAGTTYTIQMTTFVGITTTSLQTLQAAPISIAALASNSSCVGGASGSASVQANGSMTGYNYAWYGPLSPNPISTSTTAANLAPGVYTIQVAALTAACGSVTATVTINIAPPTTYTVFKPFCGNEAYLSASGSNFQWYNGTNLISAASGGTASDYTVTGAANGQVYALSLTTLQGCEDSVTFVLLQTSPGSMNVTNVSYACPGASNASASINMTPALNAPPGLNSYSVFSTSTPPVTQYTAALSLTASNYYIATGMPAGTYSVIGFDGACKYSSTFSVQDYVYDYQVSPLTATLCPGNSILASLSFSVPITPNQYSFQWSPATWILGGPISATNIAVLITPTVPVGSMVNITYSITVTPSVVNCPITKTISVVAANSVTPVFNTLAPFCTNASSFAISVFPAGGTFSTGSGSWLNPTTGVITPSLAAAGTYTFAYFSSIGSCIDPGTSSITVVQFNNATLTATLVNICNTYPLFSLAGYATSPGGTWSGAGVTPSGTVVPAVLMLGINSFTCSFPSSPNPTLCPNTQTINVLMNQYQTAFLSSSIPDQCATGTAFNLMSIPQNIMGTWSGPNVVNNVFTPNLPTGTYTLFYNNASTPDPLICPASSSITVYVLDPQTPTITAVNIQCKNGTAVQLGVTPNYGAFIPSVFLTAGGLFTPSLSSTGINPVQYVVGTASCGAQSSLAITVINPPTISIAGSTLICAGETITLTASGASTYSWNTGATGTVLTVGATQTATFTATGTGTNTCSNSKSYTVTVSPCTGLSGQEASNVAIRLYPNPNSGLFTLEAPDPAAISLYDGLGRAVLEQTIDQGRNRIDMSGLSDGIYLLRITDDHRTSFMKLIKSQH